MVLRPLERNRCVLSFCSLLLFAAGAALAAGPPALRPNVVVLVADDQRPDTIHGLGNPVIKTPNLDRLVREGAAFTRTVCGNPICTPSRAEIMTGCSSFRNGVLDFGGKIAPGLICWASAMQNAGYHTCYVGKWHNDGRPSTHGYSESRGLFSGGGGRWWKGGVDYRGLEVTGYRGWVFQTDDRQLNPELGVGLTPGISRRFADAAISLIREPPAGKPFFLHVNFTAPHDPLLYPPGYEKAYRAADIPLPGNFRPRHPFDHGNLEGRDERLLPWPRTPELVRADLAAYYSVISHLDEQIGRILDALEETDQMDNTIVVFTSDHGLAIGSHGLRGKQNMYEHTIGVPLLIRGPSVPAGKQYTAQVYLRDLYPTICDLIGAPIPKSIDGKSAAPILRGQTTSIHDCVFGYFRNFQRMVRTDRWKLIYYPHLHRYQLFDLQADPLELKDLSGEATQAARLAVLRQTLDQWRHQVKDPLLSAKSSQADGVP